MIIRGGSRREDGPDLEHLCAGDAVRLSAPAPAKRCLKLSGFDEVVPYERPRDQASSADAMASTT